MKDLEGKLLNTQTESSQKKQEAIKEVTCLSEITFDPADAHEQGRVHLCMPRSFGAERVCRELAGTVGH